MLTQLRGGASPIPGRGWGMVRVVPAPRIPQEELGVLFSAEACVNFLFGSFWDFEMCCKD